MLSLALAMMASAMIARSVQMLRLSKADLQRTQQVFALDGAHLAAAAAIVRSGIPGPYGWSISTDLGWMQVTAEPESEKLSPGAAALDGALLAALDVRDADLLKARLSQADPVTRGDIADLDTSPLWRACAPKMISRLGRADAIVHRARQAPGPGPDPASWRVGEVWRVGIATSAGWRDDRVVRFTGDARHPAAVVTRRFTRESGRGGECEQIQATLAGA